MTDAQLLATGIVEAAKRLGITSATTPLTGPEVLLLLQEIEAMAAPEPSSAVLEDFAHKLRALSQQWREQADQEDRDREDESAFTHRQSADELDVVLDSLTPAAQPMHPR